MEQKMMSEFLVKANRTKAFKTLNRLCKEHGFMLRWCYRLPENGHYAIAVCPSQGSFKFAGQDAVTVAPYKKKEITNKYSLGCTVNMVCNCRVYSLGMRDFNEEFGKVTEFARALEDAIWDLAPEDFDVPGYNTAA